MLGRRVRLFLVTWALAASAAAQGGIYLPVVPAPDGHPPVTARSCLVEFDGLTEVTARCPRPCYQESWDGPVLWAGNACERTIWVSYLYEGADGRSYRTPCYELAPGTDAPIGDPAITPWTRRLMLITIEPGPGFPRTSVRATCLPFRSPVDEPPAWLDER